MNFRYLLEIAIEASINAGNAIMQVYNKPIDVEFKGDNSPLTQADKEANDIIVSFLSKTNIPIISEENKQKPFNERKDWKLCWIVDPLDGTKEFIKRNGEFTVNIALSINGKPEIGVIYVPVSRVIYYSIVSEKCAYKVSIADKNLKFDSLFSDELKIEPSKINQSKIRVVGSRSHMNDETEDFVNGLRKYYENVEIVSKGSSLKFCLVAEGEADIYPRFAPTMEWDTAAGHAICNSVGISVISNETDQNLLYNKENLLNPWFLVSKNEGSII